MTYKVIVAQSAEEDRDCIIRYLLHELKSKQAATHFMDELDMIIGELQREPLAYSPARDLRLAKKGYRVALFMNYLALFLVDDSVVKVARIFHQSQEYARLL